MLSALRNFALTFTIAAIIFGLIAYFVVGFVLDTLTVTISATPEPNDTAQLILPEDTTSADTTGPETPDQPVEEIDGETFNILLVGTDYQPDLFDDYDYEEKWTGEGFPDRRSRKISADMIILMRIDKENRKFVFCSLPRNTRVLVDGIYMQLGDVYAQKGIDFLCGKVTGLTGLEMDYYAILDVGGIAEVVDAFGGISYYVPEDMEYEDPEQNLIISLKKGTQTIKGEEAAQLLRYAGYGTNARMSTAVSFIEAMMDKFTNITYITKAPEIYKKVTEIVTTNFTADDLMNNIDLIFSYSKFEAVSVSYPGSSKVYENVTYFEPSLANALDIFASYKK
ncbi:MAG: LCP family protein [Clostridia bacterium]|nr:LCP family protein [Clostridia bacterium]